MRGAAYRMISRIRSRASPRWQWVVQSWQLPSWPWGHMAVRASVASTVSRHEGQSPQGSFLPEWCALQNMRPIASRTLRSFSVRLLSMFSIISIECMIRKSRYHVCCDNNIHLRMGRSWNEASSLQQRSCSTDRNRNKSKRCSDVSEHANAVTKKARASIGWVTSSRRKTRPSCS